MKKMVLAVVVAAAIVGGGLYWKNTHSSSELVGIASVNGRLELNRLDISTLYAGRVEEMLVNEGDNVAQNQPLARLSSTQTQSQVHSTQAQVSAAQAQVAQAKAQKQRAAETVARANAEISAQQQQVAVAKLELDNARKLRAENLVSTSELERRQANYKAALAAVETAKAAKAEAQATVNQASATISQAEAAVGQMQAVASQAQSQNDDMLIRAPKAGRIEYKIAEVGNVLGVGGKVVSLLDLDDVYINIFLPSHQSNQVKIGDEARIKIDGSNYVFPAKVVYVASDAQFTPKSIETEEERSKLVFKVKLQIPAEITKQYEPWLKGGMPAMGYVKYDAQSAWDASLNVNLPQGN